MTVTWSLTLVRHTRPPNRTAAALRSAVAVLNFPTGRAFFTSRLKVRIRPALTRPGKLSLTLTRCLR